MFRNLKDGKLFLLENDPFVRPSRSTREEYFWLCTSCAATMTLRLGETGEVIPISLPPILREKPNTVALHSEDRRAGLLLRSVSSPRLGQGRSRIRIATLRDAEHAA